MKDDQIAFTGDDSWLVMDLYRFLHFLNVFYNRLYVLKKYERATQKLGFSEIKKDLDNSLYQIEKGDELKVVEISLQSPLNLSFQGIGEILKEVREFFKDVRYRNKQEEQEQELIIAERAADLQMKESEAELMEIKVIRKKLSLLKDAGLSNDEVREITKSLINPAQKMVKSGENNNVHLIEQ